MKKTEKDIISFNKKILLGIAPAMPIIGVLLSKNQIGPLILFIMGIGCGLLIGRFSKS